MYQIVPRLSIEEIMFCIISVSIISMDEKVGGIRRKNEFLMIDFDNLEL